MPTSYLADAVLAIALSLPQHRAPAEPDQDYTERLTQISLAIADTVDKRVCPHDLEDWIEPEGPPAGCWPGDSASLAGVLLELAYDESGFARSVHVQGPRRDNGGWAISLWSLHAWSLVPWSEWRGLGGLNGTERSARAAARVITFARRRCKSLEGALALYATGRSCRWSGASSRAWRARWLAERLRRELSRG